MSGSHNRPVQSGTMYDGLLPLLIPENISEKCWQIYKVVQKTELPFGITNSQGGNKYQALYMVAVHGRYNMGKAIGDYPAWPQTEITQGRNDHIAVPHRHFYGSWVANIAHPDDQVFTISTPYFIGISYKGGDAKTIVKEFPHY